MNRIYISISIFAIILLLCIAGLFMIHLITGDLIQVLEEAKDAANNDDYLTANEKADKVMEMWERYEPLLSTFIRHSELDVVGLSINSLPTLIENGDISEFCSECEKSISKLEHIWKSELPSYRNLL